MPMPYLDYVMVVADNIAGCAGFMPAVRDTIDAANAVLDDFDVSVREANWFWQTVAAELFMRRPSEGPERATAITTAAMEVLKELDSDGPVL